MEREKRKFPRISSHLLTRYKDSYGGYKVVTLKNLSAGGALFITDDPLKPEKDINIEINFPGSGRVPVKAKVLRRNQTNRFSFSFYETAVKFISKSEGIKSDPEIDEYLKNIIENKMMASL